MAHSSLLGIDRAAPEPAGRDKASLGPGDSSDSGSDVSGLDSEDDGADPGLPVDVALRDDQASPLPLGESLASSEGEAGVRDGADIGVDRVFTPGEADDDGDALLAGVDEAQVDDDEADEGDEGDEARQTQGRRRGPRTASAESEERPGDAGAESSHSPGRS